MRLIDADELIKAFNEAQVEFDEYYKGLGRAKVITDNALTVDAIPNAEGYEMYNKGYVQGYERGKAEARPKGESISREVMELYKRYQPRLATNVYEFGVELQALLGRLER